MKLHSLLLPLLAVPILSISLPAKSEPSLIPNINININPQQVDEVVDFGTRSVNEQVNQKAFKIDVQVPLGHTKFVVTPPQPFNLNTHNGQIDTNRRGEIEASLNSSGLSAGAHQKVVTILTEKKLIIKRVLLKVKIVPSSTTPGFPNGEDPRTKP
ncbi:hypothetical protein [Chamaesiphon minutus]|uniref:AMIN domain-containing protein n=1 Tax=Chamaesiphon minutus (strain ATCC 27169 / PCC 6605) TaxID=1173020 RepID=K9UDU8_CHAP6|nr:hypothetical protein [Chamaesiphon minutus]AFY93272.1 hypothetical protein Cha6605_2189 [Chamaesiphon minutus PCC 6605]